VGPLVQACEMSMPADEFMLAFAMNTPVANLLYDCDLKFVIQMAVRMGMHAAQHNDPMQLAERYGVADGPRFLFCAVKPSRRPPRVRLASIALAGAPLWYTNVGTSERQILLVHEVGDLESRTNESEHLEYLLAWPMERQRLTSETPSTIDKSESPPIATELSPESSEEHNHNEMAYVIAQNETTRSEDEIEAHDGY